MHTFFLPIRLRICYILELIGKRPRERFFPNDSALFHNQFTLNFLGGILNKYSQLMLTNIRQERG